MKVFRIRIDSVNLLPKDEWLDIAEFDENEVLKIVKMHLSSHSLFLPQDSIPTYSWHNNTLHVIGVARFDDPNAPLGGFL